MPHSHPIPLLSSLPTQLTQLLTQLAQCLSFEPAPPKRSAVHVLPTERPELIKERRKVGFNRILPMHHVHNVMRIYSSRFRRGWVKFAVPGQCLAAIEWLWSLNLPTWIWTLQKVWYLWCTYVFIVHTVYWYIDVCMYVRMHPNQEGCIRMYASCNTYSKKTGCASYAVQCTYIRTDVHFRVTYIRIYVYCPVCTLSTQFINCHLFPIFLSLLSSSLDKWTNWRRYCRQRRSFWKAHGRTWSNCSEFVPRVVGGGIGTSTLCHLSGSNLDLQ